MNMLWDKFAKTIFYPLVKNVKNFDEFNKELSLLPDKKIKGDCFEYFAKLYFELLPTNKEQYKKFYLYTQIPIKIKKHTELPQKDKGIDGILITCDNKIYAVQIKFRSNQKKIIPFGKIATFLALTFGSNVKNISKGLLFTNCYNTCNEIKGSKYTNIVCDNFYKCDNIFWNNVRKYISNDDVMNYQIMKPLHHQKVILPIIERYYKENNNGRLYMPCGTGKTFISYWLSTKMLKCDKIFIVVPSLYLLSETYETWVTESQYIIPKYHFTLIGSDINNKNECEYEPTTDVNVIKNNIKKYKRHIIITTYQSSNLLLIACKKLNFKFEIGIFDEAHRTTGISDKQFTCIISNKYNVAIKRLFMTATEKIYNYSNSFIKNKQQIFSMDNEKIYGKIIYKYSTRQAINDKQLVDYKIIAPFIITNTYDTIIKNNHIIRTLNKKNYEMRLILLCATIKKSMDVHNFNHLLIFSNNNNKARQIYNILCVLFDNYDIYLQCLSGHDNMTIRKNEVIEFEKSKRGIISSARIFGEGVDIKMCDAVCFADNKGSSIDIVQYVGRCLRKCENKPDKIGHVIIPFLIEKEYEDNFFTNDNESFLKLRRIMKTLSETDEIITENFMVMDCGKQIIFNRKELKKIYASFAYHTTLNVNIFTQQIISKIFDRDGFQDSRIRKIIIQENNKRYVEGKELIDTKYKCIDFLNKKGIMDDLPNPKNWIKYCTDYKLFDIITNKYYYDKNNFINACTKLKIYSCNDYKIKHNKDPKLPPIEYINNGFYHDIDNKFNLQLVLNTDTESDDDI